LDLFADFLYREILELIDLDWAGKTDVNKCRPFHIMPRFARDLPGTSIPLALLTCLFWFLSKW